MNRIPDTPDDAHPDRFVRCQEVMDDAFSMIAATAVEAGWHPEEVAAALVELADNHMLAVLANRGLERDLAVLRKGRP